MKNLFFFVIFPKIKLYGRTHFVALWVPDSLIKDMPTVLSSKKKGKKKKKSQQYLIDLKYCSVEMKMIWALLVGMGRGLADWKRWRAIWPDSLWLSWWGNLYSVLRWLVSCLIGRSFFFGSVRPLSGHFSCFSYSI